MESDRPKLPEFVEWEELHRGFEACEAKELPVQVYRGREVEKRSTIIDLVKQLDMIYRRDLLAQQERMTCPRCDSPNTKLLTGCYDEYSLFPLSHYCKNCRNCWPKDDALQNISSSSAAAAKHPVSAASAEDKKGSQNSNNSGEIAETLPLKEPGRSTVGYNCKYWLIINESATGSGIWKPNIDKRKYASSILTPPSQKYSIFASIQPPAIPSIQYTPHADVRIDISNGNNGFLIHQPWKHGNLLKNPRSDDDAMNIMSGTFMAVGGQVIAGLMVNRISSSSGAAWAGSSVELATVFGLCATLAGISLRGRSRALSALMIKIGAVITATAIVFSMGLNLPPVIAWTVGPVMFLIMAVAAAFA